MSKPTRFEPTRALSKATKLAMKAEASAALTNIIVQELVAGSVDLAGGGGATYHFRHGGGKGSTLIVHVTHGAMMLERDDMIPAMWAAVAAPKCSAKSAWNKAVGAGLAKKGAVHVNYLQLPPFPGKPTSAIWQMYAVSDPMRTWRMDGATCAVVEQP